MNNGLPLHEQSFDALAAALRGKKISATELAQYFLQRSKEYVHLGVFLAQDEEYTLHQARAADARLAAGDANPLLGIPIAHKDIYVTRDFPTTAGSKMLNHYRSSFDATVVQNLAQAGMVALGKLNCDEFAMGSANENSAYGVVRNPWDLAKVPGGSSGGSAAAVAAGLSPATTGSDTGGSIRQPASFCGITGIKPTYGRASRYGMVAFASSLDQAGPMARTAKDCALLLSALCGSDLERDSTSLDFPKEDFTVGLEGALSGKRIGVAQQFFGDGLDEDVRQALDQALAVYEQLGAQLVPIDLPLIELSIPAYYIIAPAEASSNLSRYDGVRYGFRADSFDDLNDMYRQSRSQGFGAEVQRRILLGTYVLSHGYYDAYYVKAQKIRRLIANDFQGAFALCDWIAAPCAPSVAWSIGAHQNNPLADYLADMYTLPASLAGLPAMAFPVGFGAAGLPVGMQLIANYGKETSLLNAAHQFQAETDWHLKHAQAYLAAASEESR